MDEPAIIRITGFSGTYEELYQDSLVIERNGKISYQGVVGTEKRLWSSESLSAGFQILFSSLVIELMTMNRTPLVTDESIGGYHIELECMDEDRITSSFHGVMEENEHSDLRELLSELFPCYEELPPYMEPLVSKEELDEASTVVS